MTAFTYTSAPNNASSATFRAWGSLIGPNIETGGWVKTSDTGQINWTTVDLPASINTSAGYEIYRMNDSLQATAPCFMKLEFGTGSATSSPAIWITIGTGSDGSGNITGALLTRYQMVGTGNHITSSCYLGIASNRLSVVLWASANYCLSFSLERTHNSSGADDATGFLFFFAKQGSRASAYLPNSGSIPAMQTAWNSCVPPSGSGALAPDIFTYPVRCWRPGETMPSFNTIAYVSTDFSNLVTINVTGYDGVSRTYLTLGSILGNSTYGGTGYVAWRYE